MSTHLPTRDGPQEDLRWAGRGADRAPVRVAGTGRRRVPYLLLGVLLVLGCVTAGVLVATQLGDRESVLVLKQPVTAGQRLDANDLDEVSISGDRGLAAVSAQSRDAVVGRVVAYSLPAGALLTDSVLGEVKVPPADQAMVAVGLQTGQFPAGLQPGNRVEAVVAPDSGDSTAGAAPQPTSWQATVTAVQPAEEEQLTVVTLQLAAADARQVAAVSDGQLRLVVVAGGGGR